MVFRNAYLMKEASTINFLIYSNRILMYTISLRVMIFLVNLSISVTYKFKMLKLIHIPKTSDMAKHHTYAHKLWSY